MFHSVNDFLLILHPSLNSSNLVIEIVELMNLKVRSLSFVFFLLLLSFKSLTLVFTFLQFELFLLLQFSIVLALLFDAVKNYVRLWRFSLDIEVL